MKAAGMGRRNGAYAFVPVRLAHPCPKCKAPRGRKCGREVGYQWVVMEGVHRERSALNPRGKGRNET